MKVFISWSGERSKLVAELLSEWIQLVIQAVEPWISSKDIERGSLWFSEISNQLQDTRVGIVCLTKENREKPWILFESGALSKGIPTNRIYTFLIDLSPSDIENPLAQFNHTKPNKEELLALISSINRELKDRSLSPSILEKSFSTYWPQFESRFNNILKDIPENTVEKLRSDDNILIELLTTIRAMDKRMRYLEREKTLTLDNEGKIVVSGLEQPNTNSLNETIIELKKKGYPAHEIALELRSSGHLISTPRLLRLINRLEGSL